MTSSTTDNLIQVADLVDRPGASREVDLSLPVPDEFELPLAAVREPVRLDGVVESVVDGMLVRGQLSAEVGLACARCLRAVTHPAHVDVVELFANPAALDEEDELEEGYELAEGHLDVTTLVRDALASAIPYRPLCATDCAGLCAFCGHDLNESDCDCEEDDLDPRWEALRGLQLPEGHGPEGTG
ncbi:DUF177 domain-containing protein [Egibacter rhizosphaerae]|uniref:DUF177 domain-containing protein n=1 Tax=Egibacter rhizosphaerae TaxID=1670831 RepID=A0A411YCT8_9ACTN|nr:DUF177 domain-containing protein [Egibacter rhizosphaerae]QBI18985.1 DUF177 domain-containing protein [Egibacter rhizosphaerae]